MNTETEIHAPEQRPAVPGVYKRFFLKSTRYSFWNGQYWGVLVHTAERAIEYQSTPSGEQELPWCGLAKESA